MLAETYVWLRFIIDLFVLKFRLEISTWKSNFSIYCSEFRKMACQLILILEFAYKYYCFLIHVRFKSEYFRFVNWLNFIGSALRDGHCKLEIRVETLQKLLSDPAESVLSPSGLETRSAVSASSSVTSGFASSTSFTNPLADTLPHLKYLKLRGSRSTFSGVLDLSELVGLLYFEVSTFSQLNLVRGFSPCIQPHLVYLVCTHCAMSALSDLFPYAAQFLGARSARKMSTISDTRSTRSTAFGILDSDSYSAAGAGDADGDFDSVHSVSPASAPEWNSIEFLTVPERFS